MELTTSYKYTSGECSSRFPIAVPGVYVWWWVAEATLNLLLYE